jgi:hypothetical protein
MKVQQLPNDILELIEFMRKNQEKMEMEMEKQWAREARIKAKEKRELYRGLL